MMKNPMRFNWSCLVAQSALIMAVVLFPLIAQAEIQESRSRNFILHTDMSSEEATELLERLETLLGLISKYWGRPNPRPIEMHVIRDKSQWSGANIPSQAWDMVVKGGGLTIGQKRSIGEVWQAKAVVYAVADRGTPQHEAVHAYCNQAFGSTGPVWYSEGMAEVGTYWRGPDDKTVNCDPNVIRYLKETPIKPLKELVDQNQFTGDSWQNYAWRWSLCHLLGYNENYAKRFKPLGMALMAEQPRVDFWSVYGSMAREIEFEHQLFIQHLTVGYRVDLCTWDWSSRFTPLRGSRAASVKIHAERGWQPTRIEMEQREQYSFKATGEWQIDDQTRVSAAGNENGTGKLVGVIFEDYQLSEEFELGEEGEFTPPQSGRLFVRCKDEWNDLGNNSGEISLRISRAQ